MTFKLTLMSWNWCKIGPKSYDFTFVVTKSNEKSNDFTKSYDFTFVVMTLYFSWPSKVKLILVYHIMKQCKQERYTWLLDPIEQVDLASLCLASPIPLTLEDFGRMSYCFINAPSFVICWDTDKEDASQNWSGNSRHVYSSTKYQVLLITYL